MIQITTDNKPRYSGVNIDYEARAIAGEIIEKIKTKKDEALFEYIKRLDRYDLSEGLEITDFEGGDAIDNRLKDALVYAANRITKFSEMQLQKSWFDIDERGVVLGEKIAAVERVGIYVPGGKAVYTSTLLMNALPASVAGVKSIVVATPTIEGYIDPSLLFAAKIAGVSKIYRMGGAHAIAAMAYGTESVEPVDVITGPGNRFVAEAKRLVAGIVKIDSVAGPSEVLIYIDDEKYIDYAAIDVIAQAEHDAMAVASIVTIDRKLAEKLKQKITEKAGTVKRAEIVKKALEKSKIYLCKDVSAAIKLIDNVAPEHLELISETAWQLAYRVRNAGAIFVGKYSPAAIGDYVAGPNHTLPTGASSRFSSPLSTEIFLKRSSIISYNRDGFSEDAPFAIEIAKQEGLFNHADSIKERLENRVSNANKELT